MENVSNFFLGRPISSLASLASLKADILFATSSSSPNSGIQIWSWSGPESEELEPFQIGNLKQTHSISVLKYLPLDNGLRSAIVSGNVIGELNVALYNEGEEGCGMSTFGLGKLHKGPVTCLDTQLDRGFLVSVGEDGTSTVWDVQNDSPVQTSKRCSESCLNSVKWLTSNTFLTTSHSTEMQIWDLRSGNSSPVKVLKENDHSNTERRVWTADQHPGRSWLLASAASGPSNDVSPSIMFHDLRAAPQPVLVNNNLHSSYIWQVQFHHTHPDCILSCSEDGTLNLWNTAHSFEASHQLKSASISIKPPKSQIIKQLRNDGMPINYFQLDRQHNLVISASESEAVTFNFLNDIPL